MTAPAKARWYGAIWRWHFYAGLFVLPFILILSVTGSIYLFKPQIDRWEERAFRGPDNGAEVSADRQLAAALAANPGARFNHYRLPQQPGDAAMIQVTLANGVLREVYVSRQGRVLGGFDPEARISAVVARIHGSLLIGKWGDWLVELAASWTIVMILTGLYLWWPRPFRAAGMLWPRLSLRGRPLLKDLHRVTGFWIAGLVLLMLASGLPWASAWGTAFKWARTEMGLIEGRQDWKIGAAASHAEHHHDVPAQPMQQMPPPAPVTGLPLTAFVAMAEGENLAFPALVLPPHAQQRFGPPTGNVWTVKSEAQNRRLQREVTYDPASGIETSRSGFADKHVIDRIVNTGIAWHEGQLFGIANQLLGVVTALGLIATSVIGFLMWLRRRPTGKIGAPPRVAGMPMRGALAIFVLTGLLLPLFGASALCLLLIDKAISAIASRQRRW